MSQMELPSERLSTTDAEGWRVFLHPLETHGRFRNFRNLFETILILIFLITPWSSIGGVQTILLDIPHRRFALFGTTFWAHDAPIVFFIFAGVAFTLAFTAITFGRVWCGWACPQTVFIDGLFRRVEAWIEGDAHARKALDQQKMNFNKFFKRSLKWGVFTLFALAIANSLLAYFVGAERMAGMVKNSPENNIVEFSITIFVTAVLLFNFGWFREQFCIIMCPYGRMQSVLMDENSLVVMYDQNRGEPRKGSVAAATGKQGDCVNCFKCVAVCPTGIDIRRGTQLECIGCAMCVDACDDIMTKVKKPKGLIRYGRENPQASWMHSKNIFFFSLLVFIGTGLTYTLLTRKTFSFAILRASGSPYESISDELLTNHFHLEANNHLPKSVTLKVQAEGAEVVMAENSISLRPGETSRVDFFLRFPKGILLKGKAKTVVQMTTENDYFTQEVPLVGPIN